MKKALITLFFLLSSLITFSQTDEEGYEYISIDPQGQKWSIKIDKIDNGKIDLWVKNTRLKKILINKNSKKRKTVNVGFQLSFISLNCEQKTYDSTDYIIYDKNGNVVESGDQFIYEKRIFPNSFIDNVRNKICE
jgi:hypothetical protein